MSVSCRLGGHFESHSIPFYHLTAKLYLLHVQLNERGIKLLGRPLCAIKCILLHNCLDVAKQGD